ncbi:efflux RND transporter periplasmic adaptor subunit [Desulfurivibrio dismutans]|uniref:efflux RND transporter periplasmic adaptor subunit n=1 Tax=Desulfurivibrio dismutans TaxID=1398908 RepID=UPI0023DB87D2|nr:efflux RND transporter periplasmic adaptor subunit [Desulfurivibrio alkaliphilus]MDF1613869.1 efflux RND transporter periplasmic adaptor subunit [Desulfurivibrio alkaliphilus]
MRFAFLRPAGRLLPIAAGLLAGIGLLVLLVVNRQIPDHGETGPKVPTLAVIKVQPQQLRLEARGHGVSRPAETWQAIANVAGRVVERHPKLESGNLLPKGTLLLALDPSRYRLAIAEAEAEQASLSAEQSLLDTEEENTGRLLALEQERLNLAEQELARFEQLVEEGSVSRSQRDEQRRATVAQRQAVASLENQLALLPSRRDTLGAQMARAQARLEQARQDLADTRFVAPYDLRLGEVEVELHHYAAAGQRLFSADSIEAAEIETHIPLPMLRRLMGSVVRPTPPEDTLDIGQRLDFSAIEAQVRLAGFDDIRWPARVTRVTSGLDPTTRAARVVVTVKAPYAGVAPPDRPALQPGMYVQVRLNAMSRESQLVIPATAVHAGEVYRVTDDDRLERVAVTVAFEQHDLAVITEGLSPGDRVIVDDPVPALDGMALEPRRDTALERRLQALARGETP